ncbi:MULTISPECIES: hypothetical protein [unclassified Serinicoccus]|uniref:hypothetical protein n=1 Tax=unclassified Serinicoccus TaxID=2643101 RepID=UPI003853070A
MMAPTTEDLRSTLRQLSQDHPAPAPQDLLAELRGTRAARRRRAGWIAAGGVAAAAAGVLVVGQAWPEQTAVAPAGDTLGTEQEWTLTDGAPPEMAGGLTLLESTELEGASEATVPSPDGGTQRYAVLWCDTGPVDDPAIQPPRLRLPQIDVTVPCLSDDGTPDQVSPVPLPPTDQPWAGTWEGDLPEGSSAVLGVYEEAEWSGYPFAGWPDPPLAAPAPEDGAVVIDPDTAQRLVSGLEDAPDGAATRVRAADVTVGDNSTLQVWTGMPGRLQVWVDGTLLTDDGDSTETWREAHPALRDEHLTSFTAGQQMEIPLAGDLAEVGSTVEVAVLAPQALTWQVAVTEVPGSEAEALAPLDDVDDLPDRYAGMRRVATWQVPSAAGESVLELPASLRGETPTWVFRCPGIDAVTAGTAVLTVGGERIERACVDGEPALTALEAPQRDDVGIRFDGDPTARVELPLGPDAEDGTVAAYLPVPFSEFDQATATALPSEVSAEQVREVPAEVVATVTEADLEDGRATFTLPPGSRDVVMTTTGVGRLQLLADGENVLDAPARNAPEADADWWSAWSAQETSRVLTTGIERSAAPGAEMELVVEGYPEGSLTLEVLAPAQVEE